MSPAIGARRCPEGYVSPHLSGGVECGLAAVGSFETIRDKNGFVLFEWGDPKYYRRNSQTTRTGHIMRNGCVWDFTFYCWATGKIRFVLHPPR
ncbi:MAG: hypothetical protein IKR86_02055 [Candidatus Methanomethylophilaceae archaeon]|nr:hypothetical protein [Candidatus Methanomethylophilaceae archaeon]